MKVQSGRNVGWLWQVADSCPGSVAMPTGQDIFCMVSGCCSKVLAQYV